MTDKAPISLPVWQEKRFNNKLSVSATQIETYELCARKWWLDNVRRLSPPAKGAEVFGTVLHGVCDRYLSADDLGRDESGNPVNLYPPGWEIARSRFDGTEEGRIDLHEQAIIRKLIDAAIHEGVLERQPGRKVEGNFEMILLEEACPACGGDGFDPGNGNDDACVVCNGHGIITTWTKGFIDLCYPDEVHDHKSTKAMKWAKSARKLAENAQMLIYAKFVLDRARHNGFEPESIKLRHNVYCKDPNDLRVRKTDTKVTPQFVDQQWETRFQRIAREMVGLRQRVLKWSDIPEPANIAEACNAYGGCPFKWICAGKQSEEEMQAILDNARPVGHTLASTQTMSASVSQTNPVPKGYTMDFASRLAARGAVTAGAAGAPVSVNPNPPANPNPQTAPAQTAGATPVRPPVSIVRPKPGAATPSPTPAPAAAAPSPANDAASGNGTDLPPWANTSCRACKGTGFNTKGQPCRLCDQMAKAKDLQTSAGFTFDISGQNVTWFSEDGSVAGVTFVDGLQVGEAKVEDRTTPAAAPVAAPTPAPTPAAPAAPAQTEVADEPAKDKKGAGGRPRKGFTLIINGAVVKGDGNQKSGRYVYRLNEFLVGTIGPALAKQNNVDSYYDIDVFKRRDMLMASGEMIAEEFANDIVQVDGIGSGQSDLRTLLEAIRPYAGLEIIGTGGV